MAACVQNMQLDFGRVVMDAKQTVTYDNLWKPTEKANVIVNDELDIRFTFNIWHQPISTRETAYATSRVHHVAKAAPFTWLPLLPLDSTPRLPSAWTVVGTGIPLACQPAEDDVDTIPSAATRCSSVTDIVDIEHAEPARKKQRLSLPVDTAAESAVLSGKQEKVQANLQAKDKCRRELAIRRVRMRDVDVVEDFLDQYLPEFGTGVPLRILLGSSGVAALAIQPYPPDSDLHEHIPDSSMISSPLDHALPILALVIYRKTRSGSESVVSHMQAIAVHPASRRLGLGQQLVEEALKDSMQEVKVQERTCLSKVTLKAEGYEGNGSREFWQRCIAGLKVSSRRFGCRRGWTGEAQLPCTI